MQIFFGTLRTHPEIDLNISTLDHTLLKNDENFEN